MDFWTKFAGIILTVIPVSFSAHAGSGGEFSAWLQNFKCEAAEQGIAPSTLETAFAGVEPLAAVLELDRRQPEKTLRFETYRQAIVHPARIKAARAALMQHRAALADASEKSGVPIAYILALWGVESDFGRGQGKFAVIPALATLAFEGRRRAFFTKELMAALQMIDQGETSLTQFYGSWAGATGQPQFMPSTYLAYAQDGDGDGKRDIWTNPRDVFASIGHYLMALGWRAHQPWGQEVGLPANAPADWIGLTLRKPLAEWAALGITWGNEASRPLPPDLDAALIRPDGPEGASYLVYDNFHVLRAWNRSVYFAAAIGLLADRIGDEENGNGRLE